MGQAVTSVAEVLTHLQRAVRALLPELAAEVAIDLAPPPDPAMGDFGFPCFALAKHLRQSPPTIAQDLAARVVADQVIAAASSDQAYVNIRLRPERWCAIVLGEILRRPDHFGADQVPASEHWMVEYSCPNTNKPLHLGHLRNNMLGLAVANILRFVGHRVTRVNLINDRGVHICKSMLAYQLWGQGEVPGVGSCTKKGDHLVGAYYVRFEQRFVEEYAAWQQTAEAAAALEAWRASAAGQGALRAAEKARKKAGDETAVDAATVFFAANRDAYFNSSSPLGAQVRALLRQWEDGDPQVRALWRQMNDWVLAGFAQSYDRMGVAFDHVQYESQTYTLGKALVEEGLQQGVLRQLPDRAVVCDLSQVGLKGEKVLLRSDGTSVYMTQDLGTAAERFADFSLDRLIYVVADEQNYHFEVLFKILGLLRAGLAERCYHLAYGMIRLPEGKMKSREGTVVDADELIDEMVALARSETEARAAQGKAHVEGLSADELALRAERVGMAALKYYLLKFSPRTSFEYDPKASIDFLGQTGPYCLFAYARTRSLLRRAGGEPAFDATVAARLVTDRERDLIRRLADFPSVVKRAAQTLDPSRVCEYLFELSKAFAFIFTDKDNHPIVTCDDPALRHARLMLAAAVGAVVRTGLALLGIEVLEEM